MLAAAAMFATISRRGGESTDNNSIQWFDDDTDELKTKKTKNALLLFYKSKRTGLETGFGIETERRHTIMSRAIHIRYYFVKNKHD